MQQIKDRTWEVACLVGLLALTPFLWAQQPGSAEESKPAFPSGIDVVVVDAVVLDKKGAPVSGLTRSDFEVREDGKQQTITSFEAIELPESAAGPQTPRQRVSVNTRPKETQTQRSFVVLFDNVHMAPTGIKKVKKAVADFLHTGLRAGDLVTLVPTSGGAWWSATAPDGIEDLVAAMERLEGLRPISNAIDKITDWEAMRLYLHRDSTIGSQVVRRYYEHRLIIELPGSAERAELDTGGGHPLIRVKAAEVYNALRARKQQTLKTLARVAESLAGAKGRKSIILVSEGFIHEPSVDEFRQVAKACRRANVAIYFLDTRGLTGIPFTADAERSERVDLRDLHGVLDQSVRQVDGSVSLAADTGGFSLKNANNFAKGMRKIAAESRAYYLIGYQSSNPRRDGKYRKIKVKALRDKVKVRARRGYFAPSDKPAPRPDPEALDPRVRQALDSPYAGEGIPLRMTAYVLGPAAGKKINVILVAEADPGPFAFKKQDGRFVDVLDSYVLLSNRSSGETEHQERVIELSLPPELRTRLEHSWLPVVREFTLSRGIYQARLLLRDRQGGRIGTVRHAFEVPERGQFRVSTPILTDTLQQVHGAPAGAANPIPLARRTFAAGGRVYYAFQVLGATAGADGPRVKAGYVLRKADGTPFTEMKARPVNQGPGGQLTQMLSLSLEGAAPGDYEIALQVEDDVANLKVEVNEWFTIADVEGGGALTSHDRTGSQGPGHALASTGH